MAVPGRADDRASEGTNRLIADCRAHLICSAEDIARELGWTTVGSTRVTEPAEPIPPLRGELRSVLNSIAAGETVSADELADILIVAATWLWEAKAEAGGNFKPEHIGQINFYLEALDRDVKKPNENPSVGVILCAGKDDAVVEYALSRSMSPTLVSDYTLHLPDKKLLQNKLRELTELALESGEGDEE